MNVSEYFRFAELSYAAYFDLQQGALDPDILYDNGDGMTPTQAQAFAGTWRVIDQYNHSESVEVFDESGNPTGYYLAGC